MAQIEYYMVFRWMREELHLENTELDCYAIIYSLSKGDNWFNAGVKNIMDALGKSEPCIINALKSLTKKELIVKVPVIVNNAKRHYYKATKTLDETTLNNLSNPTLNNLSNPTLNNLSPYIYKENNKEVNRKRLSNDNQKAPDELFLRFWESYGYKKGRDKAVKAWNRLNKKEKEAAIKCIPVYKEDCLKHDRNMKYPSTYLNGKTWEDDFDCDGKVSDGEGFADLPEGLTQQEWERANYWMIVNIPRLSGSISAEMHLRMVKMTHSKADVYAAILKEIEASDYDDDLMPEFERLCNTKYKERIEA
jgi:hypothetical protein